ncbi:unnamed protein product [Lactuca saligna]|uniref:Uncharacterized protein n=1 Tax=Lactuca saligna TaxID=75948 RepID=A0AA35Y8F6_LACSI|nr:unnamed protein product [Lactuca saligna]
MYYLKAETDPHTYNHTWDPMWRVSAHMWMVLDGMVTLVSEDHDPHGSLRKFARFASPILHHFPFRDKQRHQTLHLRLSSYLTNHTSQPSSLVYHQSIIQTFFYCSAPSQFL